MALFKSNAVSLRSELDSLNLAWNKLKAKTDSAIDGLGAQISVLASELSDVTTLRKELDK